MNLSPLETGDFSYFRDWPNSAIPLVAAGVYTVWHADQFIYVGMAGRGHTVQSLAQRSAEPGRNTGLFSRLASHASGRRSGDQFCVYVADRFVLPLISAGQIQAIAGGRLSMDGLARKYIHDNLSYRYLILPSGSEAADVERVVRRGHLSAGKPFLNPLDSVG